VLFIALLKKISGFAFVNVVSGMVIIFTHGAILPLFVFDDVFTSYTFFASIPYLFLKYIDTL
jgi:hypothetical protein